MSPVSASTFSLKFKIIFASLSTLGALSAGTDEVNVGTALVVVKLKVVLEVGIPA